MKMTLRNRFITTAAATSLLLAPLTIAAPAFADKAGAFIGGMVTSRVLTNMHRRTQAEEYQAYNSQPVQQAAPAPSGGESAEARIKQLDKLAAGGYITPAEYKAKKQAILNSL
jgi:hypothetical protein